MNTPEVDGQTWAADWCRIVGRNIKAARKRRKLTLESLSDACRKLGASVPKNTIHNIESGRKTQLPFTELVAISIALRVPLTWLLLDLEDSSKTQLTPIDEVRTLEALEILRGHRMLAEGMSLPWPRPHFESWCIEKMRLFYQSSGELRSTLAQIKIDHGSLEAAKLLAETAEFEEFGSESEATAAFKMLRLANLYRDNCLKIITDFGEYGPPPAIGVVAEALGLFDDA